MQKYNKGVPNHDTPLFYFQYMCKRVVNTFPRAILVFHVVFSVLSRCKDTKREYHIVTLPK